MRPIKLWDRKTTFNSLILNAISVHQVLNLNKFFALLPFDFSLNMQCPAVRINVLKSNVYIYKINLKILEA